MKKGDRSNRQGAAWREEGRRRVWRPGREGTLAVSLHRDPASFHTVRYLPLESFDSQNVLRTELSVWPSFSSPFTTESRVTAEWWALLPVCLPVCLCVQLALNLIHVYCCLYWNRCYCGQIPRTLRSVYCIKRHRHLWQTAALCRGTQIKNT